MRTVELLTSNRNSGKNQLITSLVVRIKVHKKFKKLDAVRIESEIMPENCSNAHLSNLISEIHFAALSMVYFM